MPHIVAVGLLPFCLVIAFVLLEQVLLLVPPYLVGGAIDNLGGTSLSGVFFNLSLILIFGLARALLTPIQARFITGFVQRVTLNFYIESTEIVFGKNYDLFKSSNVGGILKRSERGIKGDLPPGRPSVITRGLGVDRHRFRVWQARWARCHQTAQAPGALLLVSGCRARSAARRCCSGNATARIFCGRQPRYRISPH